MSKLEDLIKEVEILSQISQKEHPISEQTRERWRNLKCLLDEVKDEEGLENWIKCEVSGCENFADYEGWVKTRDNLGFPTNYIQKRNVCEEHKMLLIGFQKEAK
jgi:hypothetical protein